MRLSQQEPQTVSTSVQVNLSGWLGLSVWKPEFCAQMHLPRGTSSTTLRGTQQIMGLCWRNVLPANGRKPIWVKYGSNLLHCSPPQPNPFNLCGYTANDVCKAQCESVLR